MLAVLALASPHRIKASHRRRRKVTAGRFVYGNNNPYKFTDPDGRKSVVNGNRVEITPEDKTVPSANIPNNVGAKGVSNSDDHFHTYDVSTKSSLTNASKVGSAIARNPSPGKNDSASATGTRNDVGSIPTTDGTNFVRTYVALSPDPKKYTDITVNYTIAGEHGLVEGFVIKYGAIQSDGTITLRSYGEGNNWRQDPVIKDLYGYGWDARGNAVWQQNHREIIDAAAKAK